MQRQTKLIGREIEKKLHCVRFEAELGQLVLGDVLTFKTSMTDSSVTIVERYWHLVKKPRRSFFGGSNGSSSNQPLVLGWRDAHLKKSLEIYTLPANGPAKWEPLQDIDDAAGKCVVEDSGKVRLKVLADYTNIKDKPPLNGYDEISVNGVGTFGLPGEADFLLDIERQA